MRQGQRRRCFEWGTATAPWIAQLRLRPRSARCLRPPSALLQFANLRREARLTVDSGRTLVSVRRVRTVTSAEAVSSTLSEHVRGALSKVMFSSAEMHRCLCVSGSPEQSPGCQSLPLALRGLRRKSNSGRTVSVLPVLSDARKQPNGSVQDSSAGFFFT